MLLTLKSQQESTAYKGSMVRSISGSPGVSIALGFQSSIFTIPTSEKGDSTEYKGGFHSPLSHTTV